MNTKRTTAKMLKKKTNEDNQSLVPTFYLPCVKKVAQYCDNNNVRISTLLLRESISFESGPLNPNFG